MLRTAQCSREWNGTVPKLQLIGRVLPASVGPISLPGTDVNFKDGDVEGVYKVRISHSIINIECEYEPDKQHYHYPVLNNSATFVRAALNLVSFALAQPLSFTLEFAIAQNATPGPIVVTHTAMQNIGTAVNLSDGAAFNKLLHQVIEEHGHIMEIINDLRIGITETIFSFVSLNRAMEGIKQDISSGLRNDKQAWKMMQDALHVSEGYLRYITDASTDPRHGRIQQAEGRTGVEIARRCWIIANRYLEYVKRGRQELPIEEFPILEA